jgi:hypothetical protein
MFNGLSKCSNGSVEEPIWDDVAVLYGTDGHKGRSIKKRGTKGF